MATEIIQAGAGPIEQDILTTAAPVQGENTVPMQINPYVGIAAEPFTSEQAAMLLQRLEDGDIELRPDGLVYLPEIRYRRILNKTFGPGAWARNSSSTTPRRRARASCSSIRSWNARAD